MTKIEFTDEIVFGEKVIDEIRVAPLTFVELVQMWAQVSNELRGKDGSSVALLQRKRMMHQVHFMSSNERVHADGANITQLKIPVARAIIDALDVGEGVAGTLLNDGDGINVPVHYKLGTPIAAESNGKKTNIEELEFKASIFGDIEDVLAVDGEVPQGLELIRRIAKPVELSLATLPSWAVDRLTVADGVTITKSILPRFLG